MGFSRVWGSVELMPPLNYQKRHTPPTASFRKANVRFGHRSVNVLLGPLAVPVLILVLRSYSEPCPVQVGSNQGKTGSETDWTKQKLWNWPDWSHKKLALGEERKFFAGRTMNLLQVPWQ